MLYNNNNIINLSPRNNSTSVRGARARGHSLTRVHVSTAIHWPWTGPLDWTTGLGQLATGLTVDSKNGIKLMELTLSQWLWI